MVTLRITDFANSLGAASVRARDLTPVMTAARLMLVSDIKGRFDSSSGPTGEPWRPIQFRANGGHKPLMDTGLLRNSIAGRNTANEITAGTNAVQAALMNYGGTVRPKRGKYLAIPLTREAKRSGGPRRHAGPKRLVIARGGRTGVILNAETGEAMWALVKSVTIPARPFIGFSPAFELRLRRMIGNYLTTGKL